MNTVQALLGSRLHTGALGIEIETESVEPYRIPPMLSWKAVRDGSLRDFGQEYVLKAPVDRPKVKDVLTEWKECLGPLHSKLRPDSISTSVHVHVNVQEFSPLQALNFYLTGILFENVMAHYAGPDRIGNLFCLRTVDAEDQYNSIKRLVRAADSESDLLNSFNPNGYKYSNINTVPITNFGSIEFRVMRGTTNPDEIRLWSESLFDMREFSRKFDTPVSIVRKMKELGPDGLLATALGEHADQFKYQNWERDLLRNFIYVADMATCRTEWNINPSKTYEEKQREMAEQQAERARRIMAQVPAPGAVAWDEDFEEEDI